MASSTTPLTIDDFERLPAEMAEGHELADGELVDVPGNVFIHNWLRDKLGRILWLFVGPHGLGVVVCEQEYDFLGNAHGPDVSFFGPAKRPLLDKRKRVQRFVPDLAVEIASQSDTDEDLLRKKNRYLKAGTKEVWLMSPETPEVRQYTQTGARVLMGADQITTDLLPGFSITVEELFRDE